MLAGVLVRRLFPVAFHILLQLLARVNLLTAQELFQKLLCTVLIDSIILELRLNLGPHCPISLHILQLSHLLDLHLMLQLQLLKCAKGAMGPVWCHYCRLLSLPPDR